MGETIPTENGNADTIEPFLKRSTYQQLWQRKVIDRVKRLLGDKAKSGIVMPGMSLRESPCREQVCGWASVAEKELRMWAGLPGGESWGRAAVGLKAAEGLARLPDSLDRAASPSAERTLLRTLASVSLLTLRPYQRTMLWAMHHNSLLPDKFIEERAEQAEASLASGVAAFAAFASTTDKYGKGIVIGDCREDLRGTYFLIDRVLGMRTNAIVPVRMFFNDATHKGQGAAEKDSPLLALIVVSLPFARAFGVDFLNHLSRVISRELDVIPELMWELEQLHEEKRLEAMAFDLEAGVLQATMKDLVPDAFRLGGHSKPGGRLPGCVIVVGEATGAEGNAAEVKIDYAVGAVSQPHRSLFTLSELELETYGVRNRCFALKKSFKQMPSPSGTYSLWVKTRQPKGGSLGAVPESFFRTVEAVAAAATKPFEAYGPAAEQHRALDTQRTLLFPLLQHLMTDNRHYLQELVSNLRYLGWPSGATAAPAEGGQGDDPFAPLLADIGEMREWVAANRDGIDGLCLCMQTETLHIEYPASVKNPDTYLSCFNVTYDGVKRRLDEWVSSEGGAARPEDADDERGRNPALEYIENVAREFADPHNFIALCRSLNSLVNYLRKGNECCFTVKDFALEASDGGAAVGYLSSLLLPDGSRLEIKGEAGHQYRMRVETPFGCTVESLWGYNRRYLPLTSSSMLRPDNRLQLGPGGDGRGELVLKQMGGDTEIFANLVRPHGKIRDVGGRVGQVTFRDVPLARKGVTTLIQRLRTEAPEWIVGMDSLAVIPLIPVTAGMLSHSKHEYYRPTTNTFAEWSGGLGKRYLLIAGILRPPRPNNVRSRHDFEFQETPPHRGRPRPRAEEHAARAEDPFFVRFQRLLRVTLSRQEQLRKADFDKHQFILVGHIFHDICNEKNFRIHRELVSRVEELVAHGHRPLAQLGEGHCPASEVTERELARDIRYAALDSELTLNELQMLVALRKEGESRADVTYQQLKAHVGPAITSATRQAAKKLRRSHDIAEVDESLLEQACGEPEKIEPPASGPNPQLWGVIQREKPRESEGPQAKSAALSILLDNIIRNAIVGAYLYHLRGGPAPKVTIRLMQVDNCVAIGNAGSEEHWSTASSFYNQYRDDKLSKRLAPHGIALACTLADFLGIEVEARACGDSGEICLKIPERNRR
jgi:hypothetical protein